jgi:Ca2+-binding RTX toxin-like protein
LVEPVILDLSTSRMAAPVDAAVRHVQRVETLIGNDTIVGTEADEWFSTERGDDTVAAGGGDDHLDTGDGMDSLDGGDGNDVGDAGSGVDVCISIEQPIDCETRWARARGRRSREAGHHQGMEPMSSGMS